MMIPISIFLVTFLLSYLYHGLGITVGYHRLLAHRSFHVSRWLEYLIVSGGYLCFEGSPIFWVSTHRLHHRYSDSPNDPHSPRNGFWHAFIGWMFFPKVKITKEDSHNICPDLYRDRLYTLLHTGHSNMHATLCLALSITFRLALFVFFGPIVLTANLLASFMAFLSPLLVNTICHLPTIGYQSFDTADQSRNVLLIALLSLGEGWHNNHHAVPQSARHGLTKNEFDFSWLAIRALATLRLAKNIKLPKGDKAKELMKV